MKKYYLALVFTFFVLPFFAQNIPNYVPKDGLVGYWPFNGNTNDESGNGRNGKNNQVVESADRFGNAKSSYYFDGTSSYIEVSNSSNIELGGNDFTISVWVNNASNIDFYGHNLISKSINTLIVGTFDNGSSGLPNTKVNYGVGFDTYGKNYGIYPDILQKTGWNHIVCVKTSSGYSFYINSIKFTLPYNYMNQSKTDISKALFFGKRDGGFAGTNFSGYLDEIAIHNRALTDAEVQALYLATSCPITAAILPQGSVKICEGSSIVLQSADSTHVYQWFKDKQEIAGATSKSYTATKAGQYAVRVSDPTCSSMSPVTTIDTIPLPAAPILNNNIQKVCQMETIEMISQRLTNYNSTISLKWYREETGNDSINKYMTIDPYPRNYYVSQLSATSPQCESPKRTMVFMDVNMPVSVSAKGNTSFCQGDSVVLEASVANGNQYDYAWKKDYNWIDGTEGKNIFVAKESGRYSYQNRMCGMQMNGNEMEVFVKQGLKVNVGKITGSSVEFVWDTLSLSPTPREFDISYGINSTSLTQKISIPGATSYVFTGLNKGDTVRVSITPKGTDCTTPSFASAVATEIGLPNNIPTNGLVGYWPFNGNANDESGNGNDGIVHGASLTNDRYGNSNKAYNFNGAGNFIDFASNKSFNILNDITISCWSKPENFNGEQQQLVWFGDNQSAKDPYSISINSNNNFYFRRDISLGDDNMICEYLQPIPERYTHIVGRYSSLKNEMDIFIDGVLQNSIKLNNSIKYITDNMYLNFGAVDAGNGQFFNGKLDDISIHNRALTDQEIKVLYNGCIHKTATSSSFSYPSLTTSSPISLNAEPQGGTFNGVAIENNQFIPNKAKIGLNKVQYNFKNSQGCNDSTLFSMIVADTVGSKCTKIDTITVKNNVYDTITVTKNVTKYDTITVTNNVTKYDTVKINKTIFDTVTVKKNVYDTVIVPKTVTKFDTVTVTNNITKYDTVKVTKYDTLTVKNNVYDTVTITNNVTKYDTITVTNNVTKYDTVTVKKNVYDTVIVPKTVTKYDTITVTNNVTKYDTVKINKTIFDTVKVTKYDTIIFTNNITKYDTVIVNKYDTITVTNNVTKYDTITLTDTVSVLKIKFKLTTGIQANQLASMSLYPNPTTDVLNIVVGDAKALDGYRYRILDALGKEVYNELVKNAITEIPLKSLGAAGMYQFEVLDQKNVRIQANKIVLQ